MHLVESKKGGIYCESDLVARKFGLQHANVVTTIEKLLADMADLTLCSTKAKAEQFEAHYRGSDYKAYRMNQQFFSLLSMRFRGKKALAWQIKFNDAFYEMHEALIRATHNKNDFADIEWNSSRLMGNTARLEETDAIKDFIDYAGDQGSKNAKHYYSNITNVSYRALGLMVQRTPKIRDQLSGFELAELMLCERLVTNKLLEYMELNRGYKDIYKSIAEDLKIYAGSIRLSAPVPKIKESSRD